MADRLWEGFLPDSANAVSSASVFHFAHISKKNLRCTVKYCHSTWYKCKNKLQQHDGFPVLLSVRYYIIWDMQQHS